MSMKIKTMNKIAPKGLALLGDSYDVSEEHATPDAMIIRSAKVDTDEFASVLAVARAGAGTNNVTVDKASEKGICVFNAPGANANAVAELVFTGLGMALRNVHKAAAYSTSIKDTETDEELNKLVEGNKSNFKGTEAAGNVMGVIGLGKIGVLTANGAVGRGMKVIAYEPFPNISNVHQLNNEVEMTSNLSEVLAAADFLSIHVPLLDATKGLINEGTIAEMKDNAIILNFARGPIVDNDAVIKALDAGKLQSYVCDFPTKALLANDKVLALPHLGASTSEAEENCSTMVVAQLKDYLEYGIVRNSVNFPSIGEKPSPSIKTRVIVINKDVPNMIASITSVIAESGTNIASFKNESNHKIGYNIVNLETAIDASVVEKIEAMDNVLKVRVINF